MPAAQARVAGIVLAAGAGSRFGGAKLLARIDGAALLAHVVAAAREAKLEPLFVVSATDTAEHAPALGIEPAEVLVNPDPAHGLSSSVRLGLAAAAAVPAVDAAVVLLGDQPLVRAATIEALVAEILREGRDRRDVAIARHAVGGSPNPVVLARSAFELATEIDGDRGLGPVLAAHPERVIEVQIEGANPDVDTATDLATAAELAWAQRVRRNHEQVERVREVPDGADFYASVSSIFRDNPDRTGDPVLDAIRRHAAPTDTWLDIGAGAGRYALPLARATREVIAVDPSPSMLAVLTEAIRQHGIANVRSVPGRWPDALERLGTPPVADASLIAHVGYDIEAIGPFVDAMERASRRLCLAVMMERSPASLAEPFWPPIHGEQRVPLPALPAFIDLLVARGRAPEIQIVESARRRWADRDEVVGYLRRQTWLQPGSTKDRRLLELIDDWLVTNGDGSVELAVAPPLTVGVARWRPG